MNWVSGVAVFICIWWIVIFAVLPWGVKPIDTNSEGLDPGAPQNPRLALKALVTTGIASVIWLAFYFIATSDLISFREP